MKYLVYLLCGLLSLSAQAQITTLGRHTNVNTVPLLKVTVTGTVEVD